MVIRASEPLNYIEFNPGYARLTPDDEKRLDVVAKAMAARPALKLDITGRVDPRVDKDGLRLAKVDDAVRDQQIKAEGTGSNASLSKDEYNKYLKRAYKAAKFDKPRDFLGMTKSLPPDEMKKLMVANEKVSDDDLRKLADARANAVRTALVQRKIDPGRLFILAPKLNADDLKDQGKTTRTELSIS